MFFSFFTSHTLSIWCSCLLTQHHFLLTGQTHRRFSVLRWGSQSWGRPFCFPSMSGSSGRVPLVDSPQAAFFCWGWRSSSLIPEGGHAHSANTEGQWGAPGNVPTQGHRTMLWGKSLGSATRGLWSTGEQILPEPLFLVKCASHG